jgi:hypothetical protein
LAPVDATGGVAFGTPLGARFVVSTHAATKLHLVRRQEEGILADVAQSVPHGQLRFHSDVPGHDPGELCGMEKTLATQFNRLEAMFDETTAMKNELAAMESIAYGIGEVPKGFERFASAFASHTTDVQQARIDTQQTRIDTQEAKIAALRAKIEAMRSVAQREQLVSDLRGLLSDTLQEPVTAPLPVSKFSPMFLTTHVTERMYGASREETMKKALSILKCCKLPKEKQPLILLTSAPRQGKSRWLDELAKSMLKDKLPAAAGEKKLFPILISYNGLAPEDSDPQHFLCRFLTRALLALAGQSVQTSDIIRAFTFVATMSVADFRAVVDELFAIKDQTIVILVDEFSKVVDELKFPGQAEKTLSLMTKLYDYGCKLVFTGFKTSTAGTIVTASGRPVEEFSLPLVDHSCQNQYSPLKDKLIERYEAQGAPFPGFLYETVKTSPGLMGFWLEMVIDENEYSTTLRTPWSMKIKDEVSTVRSQANDYFASWARGVSVVKVLETLANSKVPIAILTHVRGAEYSFQPHPYPFVLINSFSADPQFDCPRPRDLFEFFKSLCLHLRAASDVLTWVSEAKRRSLKGNLLEVATLVMMGMRFNGSAHEGMRVPPRQQWLDPWIGCPVLGRDALELIEITQIPKLLVEELDGIVATSLKLKPTDGKRSLALQFSDFSKEPKGHALASLDTICGCWERGLVLAERNSPGFDVAGFLQAQRSPSQGEKVDGLLLLCVECKYRTFGEQNSLSVGQQLFTTLCGLLNTLETMRREGKYKKVLHMSYVFVAGCLPLRFALDELTLTSERESPFFDPSWGKATIENLRHLLQQLHGTTFSVNVVADAEACCNFLTPVVYHLLPTSVFNHDVEQNDPTTQSGVHERNL